MKAQSVQKWVHGKNGRNGGGCGRGCLVYVRGGMYRKSVRGGDFAQKTDVGTGRLRVHRKRHGKHGKWNGKTG